MDGMPPGNPKKTRTLLIRKAKPSSKSKKEILLARKPNASDDLSGPVLNLGSPTKTKSIRRDADGRPLARSIIGSVAAFEEIDALENGDEYMEPPPPTTMAGGRLTPTPASPLASSLSRPPSWVSAPPLFAPWTSGRCKNVLGVTDHSPIGECSRKKQSRARNGKSRWIGRRSPRSALQTVYQGGPRQHTSGRERETRVRATRRERRRECSDIGNAPAVGLELVLVLLALPPSFE